MSEYVVKALQKKWSESVVASFSECGPAIDHAKKLAVETGEPHEVYQVLHIGTSTIPKSDFMDLRPQAAS